MTRPEDRIAAAYREGGAGDQRHDERVASGFQTSELYERYANLAETDLAAFDRLPRQVRMATGLYINQRDAARRTGKA